MPAALWNCALLQVVGFVQLAVHTPDDELAYTSSLDRTVRGPHRRPTVRALTPCPHTVLPPVARGLAALRRAH
jgi:hypothetical protein